MEDRLHDMLTEGETLLWSGQPLTFKALDRTNQSRIVTGLVIKATATVAALTIYAQLARNSAVGIKPGVVIFIVLLAAFVMYYPFHTARRLRSNTLYGLTDKRILRVGAKEQAVAYDRIKRVTLRSDDDGQYTLLAGSRVQSLRPTRWRYEADAPFVDDPRDAEAENVVLYALPLDGSLNRILKQYLSVYSE